MSGPFFTASLYLRRFERCLRIPGHVKEIGGLQMFSQIRSVRGHRARLDGDSHMTLFRLTGIVDGPGKLFKSAMMTSSNLGGEKLNLGILRCYQILLA